MKNHNWNKIGTFIFLVGILALLGACSSSNLIRSNWINPRTSSDSLFNQTQASYFSSENSLSLKIFNNNNQLDLMVETNDPITIEKIYRFGLSIWLDPKGRSRRIYGINFPLPNENSLKFRMPSHSLSSQPVSVQLKNQYERLFPNMELVNFTPNETLTVSIKNPEKGISAELSSRPNLLFQYHLSFSMDHLYPKATSLSPGTKLSVGISSVYEDDGTHQSSLSSREVLRRRMDALKAGSGTNSIEITEQWITFELATP